MSQISENYLGRRHRKQRNLILDVSAKMMVTRALLSYVQFCSALLLSHLVYLAQHFPQPLCGLFVYLFIYLFIYLVSWRPIKSLCLWSVLLWKATTREMQWNLWSLIGSHFLFLHNVSWVTKSLCRTIGGKTVIGGVLSGLSIKIFFAGFDWFLRAPAS